MGDVRAAAVLVVALGWLPPSPAHAQDTTRADETFQAGRALLKDGKYSDACPQFEESQRHDPASGTLLALAYCQELSGLLASAWANYLAAADLASKEGHSERHGAASERAEALTKRYSTLTIVVPPELSNIAGLRVLRDGIEVTRSAYNQRIPLNGGMHSIEAAAPGRERWSGAVTLQPEADHQTLTLPLLSSQQAALTSFSAAPSAPAAPPAAPSAPAPAWRRASLVLAIGSGLAVGLGATFGLVAKSRNDASNRDGHCDASGCDAVGAERRNSALSAASAATWSFVAAGVLGAGSLALYLGGAPSQRTTRVEAGAHSGEARVSLTQTF